MSQSGFTPILIYASGTATNVPLAANLTSSASGAELALNYADGKLYFKNSSGVVTLLASSGGASGTFSSITNTGLTSGRVVYSTTGGLETDSANLTFDGTTLTSAGFAGPINGTVGATTANTGAFTTVSASSRVNTDTLNNAANSASIILRTGATTVVGNSASALVVTDTANVGIGTTSPAYKLDVVSTSADIVSRIFANATTTSARLEITNGNGTTSLNYSYVRFINNKTSSQDWRLGTYGDNSLSFVNATAATVPMVLDSSGNVGIGITNPSYKLYVVSTSASAAYFQTTSTATWAPNTSDTVFQAHNAGAANNATSLYGASVNYGDSTYTGVKFGAVASGSYSADFVVANRNGGTFQENVRITASGNVGIGTTSTSDAKVSIGGTLGAITTASRVLQVVDSAGGALFLGSSSSSYSYLIHNTSSSTSQWLYRGGVGVTLDSSGNLGLGVTPSAFTTGKSFEVGNVGNAFWGVGQTSNYVLQNLYYNGGAFKYASSNPVSAYAQNSGYHYWYNAASGTVGTTATLTQAMTLDGNGNLVIGDTSSSSGLSLVRSGSTTAELKLNQTGTGGRDYRIGSTGSGYGSAGNLIFYDATASAERARIDSSGNLLVGTTSNAGSARVNVSFSGPSNDGVDIIDSANGGGSYYIAFRNSAGTAIGTVSRVSTTNAVTYNTTSDYRLKTVVGAVTGQGARIDALKPVDYLWTEGGQQTRGFLAHEFQVVYANSVTGDKDAVDSDGNPKYQSMQASSSEVIADLVAEIQSLRKRLTALEST